MDDSALVIQADLLTVLAVTGLVLVAGVVAGVIRRAQATRRVRQIERLIARSVRDVLDGRCQHCQPHSVATPPDTDPPSAGGGGLSSTDVACNWLAVLCVLAVCVGLVGGSQHLAWTGAVALLLVPLAAAPWLTRRQQERGEATRSGWSGFDSWWRYLGVRR